MALPATTIYVTMRGANLVFGADLASVTPPTYTGGDNVSCQIVDAHIATATQTETAAATLCADAVDTIVGVTRTLELTAFQDWTDPAGLCWYLEENVLERVFFSLAIEDGGVQQGETTLAPIQYGGAAGSNLQGSVSLPVYNLTITVPTGTELTQQKSRVKKSAAARRTRAAAATAAA